MIKTGDFVAKFCMNDRIKRSRHQMGDTISQIHCLFREANTYAYSKMFGPSSEKRFKYLLRTDQSTLSGFEK